MVNPGPIHVLINIAGRGTRFLGPGFNVYVLFRYCGMRKEDDLSFKVKLEAIKSPEIRGP